MFLVLFQYSEQQRQRDPDGVGGLVAEVVPTNSCLVFCPTRKNCEAVARLICSALKRCVFVFVLGARNMYHGIISTPVIFWMNIS